MSWATVIAIILRLLPVVADILRELLEGSADRRADNPDRDPARFRGQLAGLFAGARRKLWPWQIRRRAMLRLAERMVLVRSVEILKSATVGGHVPPLTTAERNEFKAVVGH
jgi:hypothetical protein